MDLLKELFPRVRAEVLRHLFTDASVELHFRDLVRRSGLTVGTLQTELAKLSAVGVVRSERDGNRLYYRANTSHAAFGALQAVVRCSKGLAAGGVDSTAPVEETTAGMVEPRHVGAVTQSLQLPERKAFATETEKTLCLGEAALD